MYYLSSLMTNFRPQGQRIISKILPKKSLFVIFLTLIAKGSKTEKEKHKLAGTHVYPCAYPHTYSYKLHDIRNDCFLGGFSKIILKAYVNF